MPMRATRWQTTSVAIDTASSVEEGESAQASEFGDAQHNAHRLNHNLVCRRIEDQMSTRILVALAANRKSLLI